MKVPEKILIALPQRLTDSLTDNVEPNEIRLRKNQPASLTVDGKNIPLSVSLTAKEIRDCITALCEGSVYAHSDTLKDGYLRIGNGIRVGVSGISSADGSLLEITSVNIRIPHRLHGIATGAMKLIQSNRIQSTLFYSPPGIGKTTLLREIAVTLGENGKRVALIDTRDELYMESAFCHTLCDRLSGISKAKGIEIATRVLSPEVLICDEIGDSDECKAILSSQHTGVPLLASAHAGNIAELLSRPNLRLLHDSHIFHQYIGIERDRLSRCYHLTPTSWENSDKVF